MLYEVITLEIGFSLLYLGYGRGQVLLSRGL